MYGYFSDDALVAGIVVFFSSLSTYNVILLKYVFFRGGVMLAIVRQYS
jgi:hypothetical protein